MAEQDNTQIDREIQNLVNELDEYIANFDGKRQVLESTIEAKIQELKKDRGEARELRLSLHQSGDTGSEKIDNVRQWLNHKEPISAAPDYFDLSVLIVDDDPVIRDINRRAIMSFGAQTEFIIDVQEAKNGKEAVYLHLAGASFDLIFMDNQMPVMTGIQATRKLREMGVGSKIIGVSSESEKQAFKGSGATKWIKKPLNLEKLAAFCATFCF
ncbi:unnamed protein product [Dovyalis caffra]|uniref:Response regulatory domain-containing protein n=1 Tax=Dovyalis caffra TaxID=77055 RepID=A0AAV1RLZ1_9ROSI|nr:unnamed protein product [Dovyalis caffra]